MNEGKENNRKKKIIICVVAVLVLLTALILFLYNRSKISATTMRILRLEGEVTLTDDGKDKSVKENLRLNSGNELSTAVKSLVSIGLDDVKIVTLDQLSRAQFNQDGRKLDLELTAGSLFFEVQKPLEDDETMDIKTSTMIVGIRGTSGWVSVDGEHEQLIVTDGVVHVTGRNPVTGEVKEIDVHAGERITVYLYNDRKVDSIEFILEKITERELPEFVLERLRENRTLLDKVCRETGWDKPWILGETTDEVPKVVIDDNGNGDGDDNGPDNDGGPDGSDVLPAEEVDTKSPDTGNANNDATKNGSSPLTKKQLAWAHSHIAVVEPSSGVMALNDMTLFDPAFYAVTNPDVVAKYGTDPDALLYHYLTQGKAEGRPPIAPVTPTPTPTPSWVNAKPAEHHEEEEDHDDSSGSGNNGGGGSGTTYNYTGNNPIISAANSSFDFSPQNQTLTAGQDEQYIDLPVTINFNGGSKTFSSVDDIAFSNGTYTLTSGNTTKDSWGRTLDHTKLQSNQSVVTLPASNSPYDLTGNTGGAPLNISYKDKNGNLNTGPNTSQNGYMVDKLTKINWTNTENNVEASNDDGAGTTYTVEKTSTGYDVTLSGQQTGTQHFNDESSLQSYLSSKGV